MIKRLVLAIIIMFCVTGVVSAEETDLYKEQFSALGVEELEDDLPDSAQSFLEELSLDISDSGWVNSLTSEGFFSHVWGFLKEGAAAPLKAFGIILALIVLSSIITTATDNDMNETVTFATVLAVSAALLMPIYSVITATVEALSGCSNFITAFVPIFAAVTTSSGKALTSVSMSVILLLAASFVTFISNYAVIPLASGHLSLSIASSVSPLLKTGNLANSVKKLSLWILGFVSTVFIGILSIQTVVNSSADNLSMRTAKFIVGSTVPIAGGTLSEALSTVTASLSLLRSSVGIWGVLICALTFLPVLLELLIWRASLWALSFFSETFSIPKLSLLLKSVDAVLSVLIGVLLLMAALFIISLTVVILGG